MHGERTDCGGPAHNSSPVSASVRQTTALLVEAIMGDVYPSAATCVDFGLSYQPGDVRLDFPVSQPHYEALYYPVHAGEITAADLDAALGDGATLTDLVRGARCNPHKDIVFRTAWDDLRELDAAEE